MKSHARVVVIGGGVVGVSTLYHLTRKGWKDVVLLERSELTAGSTWHAAGLLPLFNMSYTVGQLHKYSVDLYKRLPGETGQEVSFHVNGNLRLATCAARMDEYQKYCGTANTIGVPFQVIGPEQVKAHRRRPLPSRRRSYRSGRPDDGAAQGCAQWRRRHL
jgi:dimethylglycine dehydrogenase